MLRNHPLGDAAHAHAVNHWRARCPESGHAGFGGRPHGKGLHPAAPRRAADPTFSMARWVAAAGTGAQLAWRVKNGARSLPAKRVAVLSDGSTLVRLRESDGMLSRRRAAEGD